MNPFRWVVCLLQWCGGHIDRDGNGVYWVCDRCGKRIVAPPLNDGL